MTAEQFLNEELNLSDSPARTLFKGYVSACEKYAEIKSQELLKELIGEIEKEAIDEDDYRNGKRISYDTVMDILNQKLKENGK